MEINDGNRDFAQQVFKTMLRNNKNDYCQSVRDLLEVVTGWKPAWVKVQGVNISLYAYNLQDSAEFADALRDLGVHGVYTIDEGLSGVEQWYRVGGSLV